MGAVIASIVLTGLGIVPLAASVTGRFKDALTVPARFALLFGSGLLLFARNTPNVWIAAGIGITLSMTVLVLPVFSTKRSV